MNWYKWYKMLFVAKYPMDNSVWNSSENQCFGIVSRPKFIILSFLLTKSCTRNLRSIAVYFHTYIYMHACMHAYIPAIASAHEKVAAPTIKNAKKKTMLTINHLYDFAHLQCERECSCILHFTIHIPPSQAHHTSILYIYITKIILWQKHFVHKNEVSTLFCLGVPALGRSTSFVRLLCSPFIHR